MCQGVCVCVYVAMSCLFFGGDSPSSLEAVQDLFSPSLYITVNGITEAMCPVLFLPPPLVPLPLPVLPFPILSLPVYVQCVWELLKAQKHRVAEQISGCGLGRCVGWDTGFD